MKVETKKKKTKASEREKNGHLKSCTKSNLYLFSQKNSCQRGRRCFTIGKGKEKPFRWPRGGKGRGHTEATRTCTGEKGRLKTSHSKERMEREKSRERERRKGQAWGVGFSRGWKIGERRGGKNFMYFRHWTQLFPYHTERKDIEGEKAGVNRKS